jgi:hypothetical protein
MCRSRRRCAHDLNLLPASVLIATFTPISFRHVADKFAASGTDLVGVQTGMRDAATRLAESADAMSGHMGEGAVGPEHRSNRHFAVRGILDVN